MTSIEVTLVCLAGVAIGIAVKFIYDKAKKKL